jgi:hypothetical protein
MSTCSPVHGAMAGTTTTRTTPVPVVTLAGVVAVAGSFEHSLALKSDRTVWAWGRNYYGVLGNGTTTGSSTPVPVTGLSWASFGHHPVNAYGASPRPFTPARPGALLAEDDPLAVAPVQVSGEVEQRSGVGAPARGAVPSRSGPCSPSTSGGVAHVPVRQRRIERRRV